MASIRQSLIRLLSVSAIDPPLQGGNYPDLDDPDVVAIRKAQGGQLGPKPTTQTRWYPSDLERAIFAADAGQLQTAARLWRSCRRDGVFMGVLSTRTGGLVRLPKKFRGRADIVAALKLGTDGKGAQGPRSVFDEMFPQAELALLAADGLGLGVGVAEMVPVKGRDYPVMRRREPEWLVYRHNENRWFYQSVIGLIPITPGDGRWILHIPGGAMAPWQNGIWQAVGRAYINKAHAQEYDANWQAKLAHPARVAVSPQGASDEHKQAWFRAVMAWGVNSVFGMSNGYDVKLLESNGRGWESFAKAIERAEREFIIAVAGQLVTTDGGAGFQNSDVHKSIRADLIKETADALAYTINTQGIPMWVIKRFGEEALDESALVEWDVTPPKDLSSAAASLMAIGNAIKALTEALTPYKKVLDVAEICQRFGVPIFGDLDGDGVADDGTDTADLEEIEISFDDDEDAENDNADTKAA